MKLPSDNEVWGYVLFVFGLAMFIYVMMEILHKKW